MNYPTKNTDEFYSNCNLEQKEGLYEILVFTLNSNFFGFQMDNMIEIINVPRIRQIPKLSKKFLGLYYYKNQIIPILDLNYVLYKKVSQNRVIENNIPKKIIILRFKKEIYGILVDRVVDIEEIDHNIIKRRLTPKDIVSDIPIENVIEYKSDFVYLLKIENLLMQDLKLNSQIYRENISNLNITEKEIEALTEISSISTGKATVALSNLLKEKISFEITMKNVVIEDLAHIDFNQSLSDEKYLGIRALIKNELEGVILLIIPLKNMIELLENIEYYENITKKIDAISDLDTLTQSALLEIGKILISHYCSAISEFFNINMVHDIPDIAIGDYSTIIKYDVINESLRTDRSIYLQTKILAENKKFSAEFVFIPASENLSYLVKLLNEDNIISAIPSEKETIPKQDNIVNEKKNRSKEKISPKIPINFDILEKSIEMDFSSKNEDEILNYSQISQQDLDTFTELGNIGAGNSGNVLSSLLKKKVFLDIPPAKIITMRKLRQIYEKNQTLVVSANNLVNGFFSGNLFLIIPLQHLNKILTLISTENITYNYNSKADISNKEILAIKQLYTDLSLPYINAIKQFLQIDLVSDQNAVLIAEFENIFKNLVNKDESDEMQVIFVETTIKMESEANIKGHFYLILRKDQINKIINRISEVW